MKKDYIPGVNMHDDRVVWTDEKIEKIIKSASAVVIASEKRQFFEQKDKTA